MEAYFPNKLKELRKTAGYTQKEVAVFLNLSHTENILRWERGYVLPGLIYLCQLALLYNVPIHELYVEIWEYFKAEINLKLQQHEKDIFVNQLAKFEAKNK